MSIKTRGNAHIRLWTLGITTQILWQVGKGVTYTQIHEGVFSNHGDVFNTITKNISSVAILNFIRFRHNNVPVCFFSIRIINPENIGVDTRIVILFRLQLETQDINTYFWILGW